MKIFAITTAAAALMLSASVASAQDGPRLYITGEGENRMVMGGDMTEGARVYMGENGARPADCPEGGFYEDSRHMIMPCSGDGEYTMMEPEEGMMMESGDPYPEGAMILDTTAEGGSTVSTGSDETGISDNETSNGSQSSEGTGGSSDAQGNSSTNSN